MARRRIEVQPISSLEDALGYKFKNQNLLRQALTHPTAVTERHPDAFKHDLTVLAFIGDAVLKYSVARYLFLNGQMDLTANRAQMHEGVQNIISNRVLGEIGEEKLHLEQYLIRGNSIQNVNMNVYADCVEAILGAIALDCEVGGQEIIFRVIEKICFDRIEH
ncbi:hypothetical protein I4U23_006074 [Adineta vaga]|nr:hypothetical protein I4U23_006074 [Adineta vaga]